MTEAAPAPPPGPVGTMAAGARFARAVRRAGPWLWLLPAMTVLVPFFLLPVAVLLRNSVYRDDPGALIVPDFVATNYLRIITDPYYADVFVNTLMVAFGVSFAALMIGYPFAYYLVRWAGRSRPFLLWAVYTPLIVSVIVRVFGWMVITADSGLINTALLSMGVIERPVRLLYEVAGMVIGLTHRYLPLMVLPLVNSMAKIDRALLAASVGLGAGAARTQLYVVLPLSIPGAVAGFQLVFAGVLSDFVLPNLMGTTRFRMLAPTIYDEAVANLSWATSAAMAIVMLLLVVAMLVCTNLALRRFAPWARTL